MPSLKDAIAALEPKVAGNPAAMLGMAHWLLPDGQAERALGMCRAALALALAPQDRKLAVQAKALINATVPRWHFRIVRDAPRTAAYDAALRRAVFPGARVLDIGTGSGLLAMMAARAGAAEAIACEI
jgi:predicted nicotinamide N-methyase